MENGSEAESGKGPIPVFVNARAGSAGRAGQAALVRSLGDAGIRVEVWSVDPHGLAPEVAGAADRGESIVGVAGGDGSVRTAAGVLAGGPTVLAPLPLGTLNHFARRMDLGEMDRATRAMATGSFTNAPVGIVDDHVFLNTATFGLYADVVRRRDRWRRRLTRWPAAVVASAVTLARLRAVQMVLDVEGIHLRRTTPLLWVGVGRSSFPFAHEAPVPDDRPVLEVVVVRSGGRLATVALISRLLGRLARRERPHGDPGLEVFQARSLLLSASASIGVTLDGELYRLDPPLFIAVQKDALRVASLGDAPPQRDRSPG